MCALLSTSRGRVVHCHVVGVDADAVAVDALARLQVVAGRNGCRVVLCNATQELLDLVAWMGLADVLPEQR